MAKLPTQYDIQIERPDPSRAVGVPTNLDAPGRAMAALGRSIAGLGQDIGSSFSLASRGSGASANEAYQAKMDTSNFIWNERISMMDTMRNVQPGGETNFADNWSKGFFDRAKEFLSGQPDSVKPVVDMALRKFDQTQYLAAREFQENEIYRKTVQDSQLLLNNEWTVDAKTTSTKDLDTVTAKIDGWLLDAVHAGRLTPIQADIMRWDLLNKVGVAHLNANQGVDENIVYRRLGVPPEKSRLVS